MNQWSGVGAVGGDVPRGARPMRGAGGGGVRVDGRRQLSVARCAISKARVASNGLNEGCQRWLKAWANDEEFRCSAPSLNLAAYETGPLNGMRYEVMVKLPNRLMVRIADNDMCSPRYRALTCPRQSDLIVP